MPTEGANNQYIVAKAKAALDGWGRADLVLNSDKEPAIVGLKRAIREQRRHETVEEPSKREGRQENGEAEVVAKDIAGMVRAQRYAQWRNTGERGNH